LVGCYFQLAHTSGCNFQLAHTSDYHFQLAPHVRLHLDSIFHRSTHHIVVNKHYFKWKRGT
jgi:hypothetical protein